MVDNDTTTHSRLFCFFSFCFSLLSYLDELACAPSLCLSLSLSLYLSLSLSVYTQADGGQRRAMARGITVQNVPGPGRGTPVVTLAVHEAEGLNYSSSIEPFVLHHVCQISYAIQSM